MAEALLRHRAARAGLDGAVMAASAGVRAEDGDPVSPEALRELAAHGIAHQGAARRFQPEDWRTYDLILAMDWPVLRQIRRLRDPDEESPAEAKLLLDFARGLDATEIYDPYGTTRYSEVYALIDQGVSGLLDYLQKEYGL